ncbi:MULTISPECIES: tyrosine-type recombinase/integrase [Nitrosomonas]|uniref:Preprotein translocase n=1 Tax=Nitrosomonas communis TaxID=44574 RepID=A0A0F7KCF4_9PROT|nr:MULTISPECIES: integrase family protein [Nitrosomonas]AKH38225.1 preprotein translocase [Nitrosomonas communis]TYP80668.1 uncharacterized protein DUF4102 [Nitrosomonas communis]UVS60200.1 integrase family protein [Nitrosomonas sp. PLL12]
MSKIKLTAGRIASFQCPIDKPQAFLWCNEVYGLGVRATPNSERKRYIFQSKVKGQTMRVTIGDVCMWSIPEAQAEARRLQILIDQGHDPRELKAQEEAAKQAEAKAIKLKERRESITVQTVWDEYIEARRPFWSELHYRDHTKVMHPGGKARSRSSELTVPGSLASLANLRLIDLTAQRIEEWAKTEAIKRPTRTRLSVRLLRAFLFWCGKHFVYQEIVTTNPAQNRSIKEITGKPKAKNDVLQREQLPAWFKSVQQIQNPVISVYLQSLLLTGARREELAQLRWEDCDFQWKSLTIRDKVDGQRVIPLTPYVSHLLSQLPRRNQWVFSSPTATSGRLTEPAIAHRKACVIAGVDLTIHGLRRSFATLSEWVEMPAGIAAQIQGHKPSGVREKNYIRRPLDLLRMWHVKIEAWILQEAGIEFTSTKASLRIMNR